MQELMTAGGAQDSFVFQLAKDIDNDQSAGAAGRRADDGSGRVSSWPATDQGRGPSRPAPAVGC
jgi:hypothetical protein